MKAPVVITQEEAVAALALLADHDAHRRELQARNTELVERARAAESGAAFWKLSADEWRILYESARDRAVALRTMLDMRTP